MLEWAKQIVNEFYKEQAIDKRGSFNNVKIFFHNDLHEIFICTILTFIFKFLINKGVANIIEPRPPLVDPWSYNDWEHIKRWENSSRIKSEVVHQEMIPIVDQE